MPSRHLWATVVIAAALAVCVSGSAIGSAGFRNNGGRTIRGVDRRFTLTTPEGVRIICNSSIQGHFNVEEDVIRKVANSPAGQIYRATLEGCTNSLGTNPTTVTPLLRPEVQRGWPITYNSFAGILPAITEILYRWRVSFLVRMATTFECLFRGGSPCWDRRRSNRTSDRVRSQKLLRASQKQNRKIEKPTRRMWPPMSPVT